MAATGKASHRCNGPRKGFRCGIRHTRNACIGAVHGVQSAGAALPSIRSIPEIRISVRFSPERRLPERRSLFGPESVSPPARRGSLRRDVSPERRSLFGPEGASPPEGEAGGRILGPRRLSLPVRFPRILRIWGSEAGGKILGSGRSSVPSSRSGRRIRDPRRIDPPSKDQGSSLLVPRPLCPELGQ